MMQDVAADQAIMQLMDARGTLMELKVSLLYKLRYMLALIGLAKGTKLYCNFNVLHDHRDACQAILLGHAPANI